MVFQDKWSLMPVISPDSFHCNNVYYSKRCLCVVVIIKLYSIYNALFYVAGQHRGHLLADSGYACRSFCLTPYLHADEQFQRNYNRAHARTRVKVEQSFGLLKRRFPCLHTELRVSPDRACPIITSCFVLHNIAIKRHDLLPDDVDVLPDHNDQPDQVLPQGNANATRDRIAREFFG